MANPFSEDLLVGAVGFETSKSSPISKAIRFKTKSDISHVFIIIGKVGDDFVILEADEKNVDVNFLDKYHTKDHKYELYLPKPVSKNVIESGIKDVITKYALTPYAYHQLLGFVLKPLANLFKSGAPLSKGMICSELGVYYLNELGFFPSIEDPNLVSPEDLRKILRNEFAWTLVGGSPFESEVLERF